MKKNLKQKIMYTVSAGLLTCTFALPFNTPVAHANTADTINEISKIFGTAAQIQAQYEEVRNHLIALGNSPKVQEKAVQETVEKYGLDENIEHNERVARVFNQLLNNGNYALKANQLPFRWRVVNSEEWNAYCYPYDYVVVNSKLIEDLKNDDALAMVLSHEMIHRFVARIPQPLRLGRNAPPFNNMV